MNRFFAVVLLVVVGFSGAVNAKEIVAVVEAWPPFTDPEDPHKGVSAEIVTAAYETQGYTVKYELVPWQRALNGVKAGKYDVLAGAWFDQERTKFLLYGEPHLPNEIKFIKRAGDDFEYQSLSSLAGKNVGTIKGYTYGDEFSNSTEFTRPEVITDVSGNGVVKNIKKLVAGRVDLVVEDEIVTRNLLMATDKSLLDKIEFTQNAFKVQRLHVVSGLQHPEHQVLIDTFNKGLKTIKDNGTFDEIMNRRGLK